jgi:hypothetical protein
LPSKHQIHETINISFQQISLLIITLANENFKGMKMLFMAIRILPLDVLNKTESFFLVWSIFRLIQTFSSQHRAALFFRI